MYKMARIKLHCYGYYGCHNSDKSDIQRTVPRDIFL